MADGQLLQLLAQQPRAFHGIVAARTGQDQREFLAAEPAGNVLASRALAEKIP
jgi:hypothetical protein